MKGPVAVLVLSGRGTVRTDVRAALAGRSAYVETAMDERQGMELCRRCQFDVVVLAGGGDALSWWTEARAEGLVSRAVLVADQVDAGLVLAALRAGVEDVFPAPLDGRALAARIFDPPRPAPRVPGRAEPEVEAELVGDSPAMRDVRSLMARAAPMPATVLIEGEPGTGKAMVARRIHALSGRPGPFVALDCGSMATELLESELFGEQGSGVPGARRDREGLLVAARSGTLFLDEVGDISPAVEARLLRALEQGTVRPAGGNGEHRIDVRVIASTRHDLLARARDGGFREDLFYLLSVIHLKLPPLRRRGADILRLAEHFGRRAAAGAGLEPPALSAAGRERLLAYSWPGNVRELKNMIERATFLGRFPEDEPGGPSRGDPADLMGYPPDWTLEEVKIDHMRRVVDACAGNKSEAARQLAVSRKTLDRKLPAD